jgi:hypothetical protein
MSFNSGTRQSIQQLPPIVYTPNSPVSLQLPQVGYLSKIWINCRVTVTTGATGTYTQTVNPVPTPYGLLKRIRVLTNEGAEIYNTTGYGNYLVQRMQRGGYDPRNPIASYASTNTGLAVFSVPATMTTSTQYTFNWNVMIPIAWQESLQAGLILLQNPTNRLTLELTFGDATQQDLITTGGTTPSVTVNSALFNPAFEFYAVPNQAADNPDTSYVHTILESQDALPGSGDFTYRPALGNIYLNVIQEFINSNARFNPNTDFTQLKLIYAQTQQAYNMTPQEFLARQRYILSGIDLPDGVFFWNFTDGTGLLELSNQRDAIDTSRLTDLSIITSISPNTTVTPGSTTYVREIREMLAPTL